MENNVVNEINIENEEELRAAKPAGEFQLFVIIILISFLKYLLQLKF
jgi:hypothetical protein